MTTITRFTKEQLIEKLQHRIAVTANYPDIEEAQLDAAIFKIALASLTAEPDYYVVVTSINVWQKFCKTRAEAEFIVSKPFNPGYSVLEIYTAQPVQETGVYKDMLNIVNLLENNEWAEHCTSTVLGSLLESEITRLVGKEQLVPIVPDEIEPDSNNTYDYVDGWNACRAAMLSGGKS
ncbi:TPA: hypothetical protein ACGAD2_005405 [Salmonella enterica subsp. enterica serovar Newport]